MTTDSRQKEIEKIAYSIWEKEGRPHGRDFDHFTQAEQIVTKQSATPAAKPAPATGKTPKARKAVAKKPAVSTRRSKKTSTS